MTDYKRFDESVWANFGKGLLDKRDSERIDKQKNFLQVCRQGKTEFLDYLKDNLYSEDGAVIGSIPVPFEHCFSEREFILATTHDTQKIIWDTFREIDEETKFLCGFWAYIIVGMIKQGKICPSFLAANPNGSASDQQGLSLIDNVLQLSEDNDKEETTKKKKKNKKIDDCVRRVLRSMCNPAPRGKRIVFYDFHLGKSYWRWHWAKKMSSNEMRSWLGLSFEQVMDALHAKNYQELSAKMHSGKSYISAPHILGGLLLFLTHIKEKGSKGLDAKNLRRVIDRLAYLSSWKAIELQPPTTNQKEIQEIVNELPAD